MTQGGGGGGGGGVGCRDGRDIILGVSFHQMRPEASGRMKARLGNKPGDSAGVVPDATLFLTEAPLQPQHQTRQPLHQALATRAPPAHRTAEHLLLGSILKSAWDFVRPRQTYFQQNKASSAHEQMGRQR